MIRTEDQIENSPTQGMRQRPAEQFTSYLTKQVTDSPNSLLTDLPTD